MFAQLKSFTLRLIAGANTATVVLTVFSGYADYISPADYPLLSLAGMGFPLLLVVNFLFLFFWLTIKWKYTIIPIAGLICCYLPIATYLPFNYKSTIPDDAVKVMTFNVEAYSGQPFLSDGFEHVLNYIKEQNADIVCLQEAIDTHQNSIKRFDSLYAYIDTTLVSKSTKEGLLNYVGILSRFPILKKERIFYESAANGSVAYWLQMRDDTVIVINNHLESNHLSLEDRTKYKEIIKGNLDGDSAKEESAFILGKLMSAAKTRSSQADSVHKYIDSFSRYPIIVCGDFNDTPISYTRRTIARGLTDCFCESGRGLGLSYNQKGFNFRIDHMMVSHHFTPMNAYVDNKIEISDHYPLICWLKNNELH